MLTLCRIDLGGLDLVVAGIATADLHASASADVQQAVTTAALINGKHVLATNGAANFKAGAAGRLVNGTVRLNRLSVRHLS